MKPVAEKATGFFIYTELDNKYRVGVFFIWMLISVGLH